MGRSDWLWLAVKVAGVFLVGAWLVAHGVVAVTQVPFVLSMNASAAWLLVGAVLQLAWGALLLFGERVWRLACGGAAARDPGRGIAAS